MLPHNNSKYTINANTIKMYGIISLLALLWFIRWELITSLRDITSQLSIIFIYQFARIPIGMMAYTKNTKIPFTQIYKHKKRIFKFIIYKTLSQFFLLVIYLKKETLNIMAPITIGALFTISKINNFIKENISVLIIQIVNINDIKSIISIICCTVIMGYISYNVNKM